MSISAHPRPRDDGYAAEFRDRTRAALAITIYELHTYLLALLCTVGEDGLAPTADLVLARRVGTLFHRYKIMSVITAVVVRGATWEDVADALGVTPTLARARYGQTVNRWRDGDPAPWNPIITNVPGGMAVEVAPAIPVDQLPELLAELDAYFQAFAISDPLARLDGELYPVSGGLPSAR